MDLLARGYAVEIVSPDAIPDNLADLELRVDNIPGNQLVASVESHDGERSASLEFVHHLRAPMVDFMRRLPEPYEVIHLSDQSIDFNAEAAVEDIEPPADSPPTAPEPVLAPTETPLHFHSEESAHLIPSSEPLPSLATEIPTDFAVDDSMIHDSTIMDSTTHYPTIDDSTIDNSTLARSTLPATPLLRGHAQPKKVLPNKIRLKLTSDLIAHGRDLLAGWHWRAALTFACVLMLAMVLGFGLRRSGKVASPIAVADSTQKVSAVSNDASWLTPAEPAKNPGQVPHEVSELATSPPTKANSDKLPKPLATGLTSATEVTPTPAANHRPGISAKHPDDLIARDTVTYLDKRFEPRSNKQSSKTKVLKHAARRPSRSRRHEGGVIATNSITYLTKPAAKTAKQ
jgi:hypothetical protein